MGMGLCYLGPSAQVLGKAVIVALAFLFNLFLLSFLEKKDTEKIERSM